MVSITDNGCHFPILLQNDLFVLNGELAVLVKSQLGLVQVIFQILPTDVVPSIGEKENKFLIKFTHANYYFNESSS